tara:strand:- start:1488 stop:1709 length:222 start_codon:yes stop_codon:yes gene_type:complete
MPVGSDSKNINETVYIDYPLEEVLFRRENSTGRIYKKFYGKQESGKVVHYSNRLYSDAIRFGEEVSQEYYDSK